MKRALAATRLLLISPAVLFLIAVVVQGLRSLQKEPAHTAHNIVMWYAERMWTLWILYRVAAGFERQCPSCQPSAESACRASPCGGEDIGRCNDRDSSSDRRNCHTAHAGKLMVVSVSNSLA
jgi:hypothetical protein